MRDDPLELAKVATAGVIGSIGSWTLADVATLGSIVVSALTGLYVIIKIWFLIRKRQPSKAPERD